MRRLLTVSAPAASHDLTELATLKAELAITGSADDALLAALITQASRAAARFCGRVFARESVSETIWLADARPPALLLGRYPVSAVSAVSEDTAALGAGDYSLDGARGLLLRRLDGRLVAWAGTLVVDYEAGYVLPGMAGSRDLPEDLERAALDLAKAAWFARRRDPALAEESLAEVVAARYRDGPGGLPPTAARLLAPYRSRQA